MQARNIDTGSGIPVSEWLYVRTNLVWATEREVEEDYQHYTYSTDNQIIAWLVRRGEVTVTTETESATARKGQWIFPGTRNGQQEIRPGTVILSIRFTAEWPTGKTLFNHHNMILFAANREILLTKAAEKLKDLVRRVSGRKGMFLLNQSVATIGDYFVIRRAFEDWLSAYINAMLKSGRDPTVMASTDHRVLKAARLLDQSSRHAPLKENELAAMVGLSVTHLNRLFQRELGVSPQKYLEQRRMEAALLLLREHKRSIKETAYELGFASLPHFSTWFKRRHGFSPTTFLKQAKTA